MFYSLYASVPAGYNSWQSDEAFLEVSIINDKAFCYLTERYQSKGNVINETLTISSIDDAISWAKQHTDKPVAVNQYDSGHRDRLVINSYTA